MSVKRLILIIIYLKLYFTRTQSKETTCLINGMKSINVVDERFLSFSIDPATLLNGFNLSSTSMKMAQHLSPSFIRIAGPSTEFIQFSEDENDLAFFEGTRNFTVTPLMWKSLIYWIENANLTPVFAISDKNRTNGVWNPASIFPLFNMSRNMNFSCYWQLGQDCNDKSIVQYKHDLFTLKQALDEYFSNRKYWKIVGSDLQVCLSRKNPDLAKKTLDFLDDATDAVIWQEQIEKNPRHFPTTPIPIWLVVPKLRQTTTFSSGLLWAKQIGDAARAGYEVIFRQPSLQELSTDTPVYWISLIYKSLMGRNVLDLRSNSLPEPNISIYAHCTKNQDNYSKQGAMTIFVVNTDTSQHTTSLRIAASHSGSIDVQSYVITSDAEDSRSTYLNGIKLTPHLLEEKQIQFNPIIRRVRISKLLKLVSPPKSVAFFVLPAAKVPVCIRKEDDINLHMKNDQEINFQGYSGLSDKGLKTQIPEEYENVVHHDLYHLMGPKSNGTNQHKTILRNSNELKKQLSSFRRPEVNDVVRKQHMTKEFRQYFDRKLKTPKENDVTAKVEIIFKERPAENQTISSHVKTVELELTNEEIKKILKGRTKSKVAENNIEMTSQELENVLKDAVEKFVENEQTVEKRKKKRNAVPNVLRKVIMKTKKMSKNDQRSRRDINMELLDLKTQKEKPYKSVFIGNEGIRATIRKLGKTSEELLKDIERSSEESRDVFAELASSLEEHDDSGEFHNDGIFIKPFRSKSQPNPSKEVPEEKLCPGARYLDERIRFLMEPSGCKTFVEEDLQQYRNFQENLRFQKMANPRPKFNSEVRNRDTVSQGSEVKFEDLSSPNTVKPQLNMEMGERYKLPTKNYGKSISQEMWDEPPVISGKDNDEVNIKIPQLEDLWKVDSFRHENDDNAAMTPRFNINWQNNKFSSGNKGKMKEMFSEEEETVTNTETRQIDMSSGNSEKSKIPFLFDTVRPELNGVTEEWDEKSARHIDEEDTSSVLKPANRELSFFQKNYENIDPYHVVTPRFNPIWQNYDFLQANNGDMKKAPSNSAELDRTTKMWKMDTATEIYSEKGKAQVYTVKPQIDREIKTWDEGFARNNEKQESPVLFSAAAASSGSEEEWESFFQGNSEKNAKYALNKEERQQDVFSQNNQATEVMPTTLTNMEETNSPSSWKAVTPFSIAKTQMDIQTNYENVYDFIPVVELQSRIKKHVMELNVVPQNNKSPSTDMLRPNNLPQENDLRTVLPLRRFNSEVSKTDKSVPDISETTPSSRMIDAIFEENLENYYCDPKNANKSYPVRLKRDEANITKDDIKNYRKFMAEQLRAMKKARSSKLQDENALRLPSKNSITNVKAKPNPLITSRDNSLSSDGEHLHFVFGKPYDLEKLHERRRAMHVEKLKQRLQNLKKLNEKPKERKIQHTDDEDTDLISSRRKRTPYNIQTNEVSDPKKKTWNSIQKYYKRRIFRPKTWKPQDIFKVKRVPSYSGEVVDKREFLQRTAPFVKNIFKETKRHRRSVGDGVDSSENTIEDHPRFKDREITKMFTDAKEENVHDQLTSVNINLSSRTSTQGWVRTTTEETNDVNPGKSIETAATSEGLTATTNLDRLTIGKTDTTRVLSNDHMQKPKDEKEDSMVESIIPPQFIDMIMEAVNGTFSSIVHLGEKLSEQFSF